MLLFSFFHAASPMLLLFPGLLILISLPPVLGQASLLEEILFEELRQATQDGEYRQCVNQLDTSCTLDQKDQRSFTDVNGELEQALGGGRKKRADVINCEADGTCTSVPEGGQNGGHNRETCCGNCKSCTFQNCCHCSFSDPDKYCPIPGWRAPDYTGKNGKPAATIQPRTPANNHQCIDALVLAGFIYRYYLALRQRTEPVPGTNWETTPYIRRDWAYVIGPNTEGYDVRPNEGFVLERRMTHNGLTRTEILERTIRPQDLRTRVGRFTPPQREGFFATHNGNNNTDQMGHIVANTLGGPNTFANCFPQHVASNNNIGGADPNAPNWVATEYEMRSFLGAGSLARYVLFRVHLIYPSTTTGRPTEIVWSAIFMDGQQVVETMGGRILNDGSPHANICQGGVPTPPPGKK